MTRIVPSRPPWAMGFRSQFLFRVIAVQAQVHAPDDWEAQREFRQALISAATKRAQLRAWARHVHGPHYLR